MRQYWLARKENKEVSLYPYIKDNRVEFKIVGDGYESMPDNFDPEKGTVSRAIATCLVCKGVVDDKTVRKLFSEGKASQRMVAVVLSKGKGAGKYYRLATEKDIEIYKEAEKYLEEKRNKLMEEWGIDPVPDEETPEGKGRGAERAFSVRNYGLNSYGDLFNSRQKLALITFTEKVRLAYKKMIEESYDQEYAKAVVTYLGLAINGLAGHNAVLCVWANSRETAGNVFGRQALPMIWDYFEVNVFSDSTGDMKSSLNWIFNVLSHILGIPPVVKEKMSNEMIEKWY